MGGRRLDVRVSRADRWVMERIQNLLMVITVSIAISSGTGSFVLGGWLMFLSLIG